MNKNLIIVSLSICFGAISLFGQVDISVSTTKKQYLQYEAIFVEIKLTNTSGRSLSFADGSGTLSLQLFNSNGSPIIPLKEDINLAENLVLQSGTTQSLEVKLNDFFDVSVTNKYNLYTKIKHPLFAGYSLKNSKPASFRVTGGVLELTKNFGISIKKKDGKESIVPRNYSILSYLRDQKTLYEFKN